MQIKLITRFIFQQQMTVKNLLHDGMHSFIYLTFLTEVANKTPTYERSLGLLRETGKVYSTRT